MVVWAAEIQQGVQDGMQDATCVTGKGCKDAIMCASAGIRRLCAACRSP